ncbi:hypothetical protein [Sphingomonas sp. S2-65]|uniref:hypothetical protein n=1 Tax=Sphingomonas sp. S2-65 TaxID=2903960 RepID=UPI001F17626E|nr:hypothetical protein [Sphingomonas sp. S2-65]UYY59801.1 hypothetical protein LZ586_06875 [Sphingomonas sp. S2-65]
MSRGPDSGTLLGRALLAAAAAAGCPARLTGSDWSRWASATFTGARHTLTLEAPPSIQLDAWLAALPEAEFRLRGHLVADIAVAGMERDNGRVLLCLEALTIEER